MSDLQPRYDCALSDHRQYRRRGPLSRRSHVNGSFSNRFLGVLVRSDVAGWPVLRFDCGGPPDASRPGWIVDFTLEHWKPAHPDDCRFGLEIFGRGTF